MVRCLKCNGGHNRITMTKTVIHTPEGNKRIYKCPLCLKQFTEEEVAEKFSWITRRRWTWKNKGDSDV